MENKKKTDKLYVTYRKDKKEISGIYLDEMVAIDKTKEPENESYYSCASIASQKGNSDRWDCPICEECHYYKKHMETIRELIGCLYRLDGCACGGLAHVVTDDDNFQDNHIDAVLEQCELDEYADREEVGLVKLIMQELKKLSIQERALFFSSYYTYAICDHDCNICPIEKGVQI